MFLAVKKDLMVLQMKGMQMTTSLVVNLQLKTGKKPMTKYQKRGDMMKYRPKVITQEHFVESWELDEMKMDDPKTSEDF